MKEFSNIVLGTASFGNKYGINNDFVDIEEALLIISNFINNGGCEIDTSINYGNSEKIISSCLKELNNNQIFITSKFQLSETTDINKIIKDIENKNKNFNNQLKCMLCHTPDIVKKGLENKLLKLINLIKSNFDLEIGISLYSYNEFDSLGENLKILIDQVQAPINVYDDTAKKVKENTNNYPFIKVSGRSIFLQGFLISDHCLNQKFSREWNIFKNFCDKLKIEKPLACLAYVLSNGGIDNYVIGVNSLKQINDLNKNLKYINENNIKINFDDVLKENLNPDLIDPRKWNL